MQRLSLLGNDYVVCWGPDRPPLGYIAVSAEEGERLLRHARSDFWIAGHYRVYRRPSFRGLPPSEPLIEVVDSTVPEEPLEEPPPSVLELVLEDRQGTRVPGARYRVVTSTKRVIEGYLDRRGEAVLTGLRPGECTVEFLGQHGAASLSGQAPLG